MDYDNVDDLLSAGKKQFERCSSYEDENRLVALEDIKFSRLSQQWPDEIVKQRQKTRRPCLTINKLPAFIRQVVNDARQNKPSIKVHPVDSGADVKTADVINGLIRNIEYTSNADVAYDTAIEASVSGGFGYWRIGMDYAYDDSFDMDLRIERVANQFSIYGDPNSTQADSSDWDDAFIIDRMPKEEFKRKYKKKKNKGGEPVCVDFDNDAWSNADDWLDDETVQIAEWWTREQVEKEIVKLSNGAVISREDFEADPELAVLAEAGAIEIVGERVTKSYKVRQIIMTGADVLEVNDFPGCYIPIVPVYGDEIVVEGKRYFRSLIHNAIDAQRMYNYWRPLALDTPLPTPTGWTTMGEIAPGDFVFDENGHPTEVVGESPVHINRECFRVTFDDGTSIVADKGHPWPVEERVGRKSAGYVWDAKIVETGDLAPGRHFINTPRPLDLQEADLPIHPYVLGVWLGDGESAGSRISQHVDDIEELRSAIMDCGHEVGIACHYADRVSTIAVRDLTHRLRKAGLLGNKHIPASYLRGSQRQREMLLQGLMDTDGSISMNGQCSFTTTTPALAAGFAELLRSLGIKAVACKREGRVRLWADGRPASEHAPSVQFSFTPLSSDNIFRLSRKASVQKRTRKEHPRRAKRYSIKSVEQVSSVPVKCIAVAASSHLFLAGEGMVPTHNTTATELVALAPRVPWIGRKGTFDSDASRWASANTDSHAYLEYDGEAPQRQPLDVGPAAGSLQEALNASDDMKAIIGIYDASLGARSNETSGKAIMARQREGDVATFHFIDNLSRAIRHTGRILLELIPHVYSGERIVRVVGEDGSQRAVPVNGQEPQQQLGPDGKPEMDEQGEIITAIHDLTSGKYDLTVTSGPSFTTRREEAAAQMTELVRAFPQGAPLIMDLMAKNFDWPGADEIAKRFEKMNPAAQQVPPEMQQQMQQMQEAIQQLQAENQKLQADHSVDQFNAETKRMQVEGDIQTDRMKIATDAETQMNGHVISAAQRASQQANQPTRQG
ncbi:portal protein [Rhizobium giardinii]|uniref:portal protein n=1 Tax=Rhizobium giardinii TaxID=56731 RepID=UPI0039E1C536